MSLTLPIVVGKKYVRRDGETVCAERCPNTDVASTSKNGVELVYESVWIGNGRFHSNDVESPFDYIADYIEPAKGHPHAERMAEFAEDAKRTFNPITLWQYRAPGQDWEEFDLSRTSGGSPGFCAWYPDYEYRRRPAITPDPHAESMRLYAEDAAQTDKAWERWEVKGPHPEAEFCNMDKHPYWDRRQQYRRKASA